MRTQPFARKPRVQRDRRLVQPDLDHRDVRSGLLEERAQLQRRDIGLRALEFVEAAAEMHREQIALVAQDRKERALAVLAPLHRGDRSSRLPQDSFAPRGVERTERFAPQPEHLMQHAPAFERVWRLVLERLRFIRERFRMF